MIQGAVGEAAGVEFVSFLRVWTQSREPSRRAQLSRRDEGIVEEMEETHSINRATTRRACHVNTRRTSDRDSLRGAPDFVPTSISPTQCSQADCLRTPRGTPRGREWIDEIKHDGYRAQGHVIGGRSIIYTRNGFDWTNRFKRVAEALKQLPARDCVVDGEIVVTDERGISDFHLLQDNLARNKTDRLAYISCLIYSISMGSIFANHLSAPLPNYSNTRLDAGILRHRTRYRRQCVGPSTRKHNYGAAG